MGWCRTVASPWAAWRPKPWRAHAAENILKGEKPTADNFAMAATDAELKAAVARKHNGFTNRALPAGDSCKRAANHRSPDPDSFPCPHPRISRPGFSCWATAGPRGRPRESHRARHLRRRCTGARRGSCGDRAEHDRAEPSRGLMRRRRKIAGRSRGPHAEKNAEAA